MNTNIKSILLDFISNPITIMSWGASKIQVSDFQITFEVSAFKYAGLVIITDIGELVKVKLQEIDTELIVKPHLVLSSLDDMIECGHDYQKNLEKWIVERII